MLEKEETVIAIFIMKLGKTSDLSLLPVAKESQLTGRACDTPWNIIIEHMIGTYKLTSRDRARLGRIRYNCLYC